MRHPLAKGTFRIGKDSGFLLIGLYAAKGKNSINLAGNSPIRFLPPYHKKNRTVHTPHPVD